LHFQRTCTIGQATPEEVAELVTANKKKDDKEFAEQAAGGAVGQVEAQVRMKSLRLRLIGGSLSAASRTSERKQP
jgi:hypothetical protein